MRSAAQLLATVVCLLAIALPLRGQSGPLIANVRARQVTSLNGEWRTIVDPYESGYYTHHRRLQAGGGFAANRKPRDKSERIEYDFDASELLTVPGDWNSQREDLFLYEGTIWYKRDFDYDLALGHRLFVYFGGANYEARAWLNGQELGVHEGGFTPFNFEVTENVQRTGNFLIVKVDNQRRREAVPTLTTDWWNYGGLTRDVMLVEVPATFMRDYAIQLDPNDPGQVVGWVQLDGPDTQQRVVVRIREADVEVEVRTDSEGFAEVRFSADLQRWSPENPQLYNVELVAETDRVAERIGFRTIQTSGHGIVLNGEPVFLRGVSIHEQAPAGDRRAFSEEDARTLLRWGQELGCNFVRLAHYPHNDYMARLADELGLMVWAEIPVYWTIAFEERATLANAKRQLAELISRDKNRASVVLWSMGNETPLGEERLQFLIALADTARSLDATRLLTAALVSHYAGRDTIVIDDPFGAYLDVVGVNEYVGWYDGLADKADRLTWQSIYDKPLIMSEFGAGALQGLHGDSLTRWTEEFQANVYRHQVEMLKRIPFLRGTTPWILTDFRSPRRPLPGIQDFWNRKGLISDKGVRKQAFHVLREFYEVVREEYQ